jgi:hypothetical protein
LDRIRSFVRHARFRLHLQALLSAALAALPVTAALVCLLVLERRLLGASSSIGVPSRSLAWLALAMVAAAAVAAAYGWWRARAVRPADDAVAIELDARVRSGERFSTALALEADATAAADPFARAAIADAVRHASDPDVASRVRQAFPVTMPPRWWVGPSVMAAAILLWATVPQLEAGGPGERDARAATAERVPTPEEERLEDVVKQIERSPELAARLDAELDAARKAIDEGATGPVRSPEQAAREAMRRMAELQARLEEVSDSRESKESKALQDALAKLELPKDANAARDLAEALKQGDFAAAKEALQTLQKQAAKDSGLSKEEREQLAKALEDTAKQLDALSKDPAKLAEALKQAGMDPSLANNPAALQEAMKQASQLNQSQREALQKMAESMQGAQSKLAQMSQEMQKSASQCRNPGQSPGQQSQQSQGQSGSEQAASQQSESQDGSSGMSQMLSEAESERQMAMAADDAKSQCQGGGDGMSESEADSALRASAEGDGQSQGAAGKKAGNSGGRAQASGGDRSMRETAFGTKFQKQKGARGEGDVIARQLVAGQAPVGESRVALEEVAGTIATGYERGSEDDPVPAHLREVHKRYFGELRQKFAEKGVKPAAPGPTNAK